MSTKEEKTAFFKEIERIVSSTDYDWLEAITFYCEKTGMEIETASMLVGDKLKKRMEESANNRNLLKKTSTLGVWNDNQ